MLNKILIISIFSATLVACDVGGIISQPESQAPSLSSEVPMIIDVNNEKKVASITIALSGIASDIAPKSLSRSWLAMPNRLAAQLGWYENIVKKSEARILQPFSELCTVNGSRSLVLNDINNNGVPDFGESISVNFNQCNDGVGSVTNGSMDLISSACTSSFIGGTCKALDIMFDLQVSDVNGSGSVQGDMTSVSHNFYQESQLDIFDMGSQTKSKRVLNSKYLSFSFGNESIVFQNLKSIQQGDSYLDYSGSLVSNNRSDETHFAVDLDVTGFMGRLIVDNWIPMSWNDQFSSYPDVGAIRITGGNGTIIGLDAATGDSNTVQVTTNGGAPQLFTWVELEQQSPIPSFF